MQIATMVLIYVIVWWVLFFMALPFGLRSSQADPETGAPKIPHLRKKALWVSGLAAAVSAVIIVFLTLYAERFYTLAATGQW